MIKMYVADLSRDKKTNIPMVVLSDEHRIRYLPILLAPGEQELILLAINESQKPEINMQSLALQAFSQFGYNISEVRLHRQQERNCGGIISLTASPKLKQPGQAITQIAINVYEAIALALRCHLPIWVPEDIVCEGSLAVDPERDQQEAHRFKEFIATVRPADFRRSDSSVQPEMS